MIGKSRDRSLVAVKMNRTESEAKPFGGNEGDQGQVDNAEG